MPLAFECSEHTNLGAGEFGDGFGTLGNGVLGQFPWKYKSYGGLDFARGKGGFFVVPYKFARFFGDLSKDVVDEGVHDGHSFLGHTGVWVDLFQNFVDVDGEALGPAAAAFGGASFLCGFLACYFGHIDLFLFCFILVCFCFRFVAFLFLFSFLSILSFRF